MKGLLIVSLLILKLIPCYGQSDSSKLYPVVKWKLDVLLDVYSYKYPKAIETTVKLDSAVQGLKIALQAGQKLIDLRTYERDLKVAEVDKCDSIAVNSEVIFKAEIKQAKRRGLKKGTIGVILGFVIGALILG